MDLPKLSVYNLSQSCIFQGVSVIPFFLQSFNLLRVAFPPRQKSLVSYTSI